MAGTERLHHGPPALALAKLQQRIETEIGITVSIGLAFNKFLAKIASDFEKPRGFSVIGEAEATTFLASKPVGLIWGVGKTMQERLAADGIRLIGTLQHMDEAELGRRYGTMGLRLARLAQGDDSRSVEPHGEAKSVSNETTFDSDIADPHELKAILRALSEKVSRRLKKAELAGVVVTLKLKTTDFRLRTRSRHLSDPTQLADRIFQAGSELLAREADGADEIPPDRHRRVGIRGPAARRPRRPDRPGRGQTGQGRARRRCDSRPLRQPAPWSWGWCSIRGGNQGRSSLSPGFRSRSIRASPQLW